MPLHAGHSTSATAIFGLRRFIGFAFLKINQSCFRGALNLSHVVVMDRTGTTVVPFNHDTAPSVCGNGPKVRCSGSPANAVVNLEKSGLVAGHR